jgi:DNA-binding NarL/FixJ family response regulator
MESKKLLRPLIRVWAGDGPEKKWMKNILSRLDERLELSGEKITSEKGGYNWGYMDDLYPPFSWPVESGSWIISSKYQAHLLEFNMRINIRAFIPAFEGPEKTLSAIYAVLNGWKITTPGLVALYPENKGEPRNPERLLEEGNLIERDKSVEFQLTAKELSVLEELALGESNKSISYKLGISESTVKFHIHSIFGKLKVQNRAQAIYEAIRLGLLIL